MKSIFAIFSLIIISLNLYAQTAQEYGENMQQFNNLVSAKEYAKAIPYGKKAASILKKLEGEQHTNYVIIINSIGTVYYFITKYDSAIVYYDTTLYLYKKYQPNNKKEYLQTISNLGLSYEKNRNYEKARLHYEEVVALKKEMYGSDNESYVSSKATLANIYKKLKMYEKAEILIEENISYFEKHYPNSEKHEIALENLADLYMYMNLKYWAAVYYTRAAEVRYKIKGEDEYYLSYTEKAGTNYEEIGMYDKAEICYGILAIIFENKNKKEYGRFSNKQGLMQMEIGNYTDAEISLHKALIAYEKEFGVDKLPVAVVSNNLGSLYLRLNNFSNAEYYYTRAYEVRKKWLNKNDVDIAECCNNLGSLYSGMHEYKKAEMFLLEAKNIYEQNLYGYEIRLSVTLNNLAHLYMKQNKYTEAEKFYLQSLNIREKYQGITHPAYARALNNLGVLYLQWKKPEQSKNYFTKAIAIIEKLFGKNYYQYIGYLNNIALCNNDLKNFDEAKKQITESNNLVSKKIIKDFTILSEYEKENYAAELIYNAKFANSILYNSKNYNKESLIDNFNQQLQLKALVLNESKSLYEFVKNNTDTVFKNLYEKYTLLKNKIAKEYGVPVAQRSKELSNWEYEADVAEKNLLLKSINFQEQKKAAQATFNDVKNSLQNDEVAIEFVKFDLYNKGETDSTLYVAYIVDKKSDAPILVPLFEKKQLQKILDSAGSTNQNMVAKLYRSSITAKKTSNANFGNDLYNLIWLPLEPYLKNAKKIHFAPVDKLNSIAFNALAVDTATYLIDKYELYQYTSTKNIIQKKSDKNNTKNIALFGNPNFSLDANTIQQYEKATDTLTVKRGGFNKDKSTTNTWVSLPGTANEINAIQTLFVKNKINTTVYTTTAATEENFKQLHNQNIHIIHIATHGFFLPRVDEEKLNSNENTTSNYQTAYDPMLRSGIVLNYANYAWNGGIVPRHKEDGIVTAYEISQLNLTKTELVILSACETALGDIKGNEGVYGLQRAFKLAGVKNLIISLWQVPDKETAELMSIFYGYYIKSNNAKDAFNKAQKQMRNKYSPYYWAAFTLVE